MSENEQQIAAAFAAGKQAGKEEAEEQFLHIVQQMNPMALAEIYCEKNLAEADVEFFVAKSILSVLYATKSVMRQIVEGVI